MRAFHNAVCWYCRKRECAPHTPPATSYLRHPCVFAAQLFVGMALVDPGNASHARHVVGILSVLAVRLVVFAVAGVPASHSGGSGSLASLFSACSTLCSRHGRACTAAVVAD